jgi:hypothetical protein
MNYPISQIERWDFYMIMPKCKYVREISISPNFAIRHLAKCAGMPYAIGNDPIGGLRKNVI